MDKGKLGSFIALALLVLSATLFSGNVLPAETSGVPEGSWGVNVENVGKIALTCRKYRSNDICEMFWIFAALPVIAEIEDGKLKIHTDKTGKEALLISLKNGEPYKFLQSSIITAKYLPHYASAEIKNLRVAGIGGYADITDFRRHGSDYNKYHERKYKF